MVQIKNDNWSKQTLPVDYLVTALNLGKEWDLLPEDVLSQSGIDIQTEPYQDKITVADYLALIAYFESLGKQTLAAMELGWRMPPSAYGALGFALLCCKNLRECLTLVDRFWPLITQDVSAFTFVEQDDSCIINLEIHPNLEAEERRFWLESSLVSWKRCVTMLLGKENIDTEIWFDFASPIETFSLSSKFGPVHYLMPVNQIICPGLNMDTPLPMHNEIALQSAIKQCEQELLLCTPSSYQWLARLQQLMVAGEEGYPTLMQLANHTAVSDRTIRRHLQKAGSSYQRLLETSRRRDAVWLLGNPALSVQRVSELLGYADQANFIRRFRQWTDVTPNQFRQKMLGSRNTELLVD